jgi:hypothetical protein
LVEVGLVGELDLVRHSLGCDAFLQSVGAGDVGLVAFLRRQVAVLLAEGDLGVLLSACGQEQGGGPPVPRPRRSTSPTGR